MLQEAVEANELPQDGMEREKASEQLTAEVILLISYERFHIKLEHFNYYHKNNANIVFGITFQ